MASLTRGARVTPARVSVLVLAIAGVVAGALAMLVWMVDETHFDRPSAEFDALERQIEAVAGVEGVDKERWVEAPTFSSPTSVMHVRVDEGGLGGLLEAACAADYPDPVTWSVRVRTPSGADVSLHAEPTGAGSPSGRRCIDFGFDATRLVAELDRVAPGLAVQPAIWEGERLALVALADEAPRGFAHLLPLVEHADTLRSAAGVDGGAVEVNGASLGLVLERGEGDDYRTLLEELARAHAVGAFWVDAGDTPSGREGSVQVVAPEEQRAAITSIIAASGLPVADLPVRFLDQ